VSALEEAVGRAPRVPSLETLDGWPGVAATGGIDFTYQRAAEYAGIDSVGQYRLAAAVIHQKLRPVADRLRCVVDFGCGAGKSSRDLARCLGHVQPATVIGVDVSERMLREAARLTHARRREHPRVEFRYRRMPAGRAGERIPLRDGMADAVASTIVLQELQTVGQLRTALREMGRVTRRGGELVLVAPSDRITCEDFTAFTYAPFPENATRRDNVRKCRSVVSSITWERDRHWSRDVIGDAAEAAGFRLHALEYPLAPATLAPFPDEPSRSWLDELHVSPFLVVHARKA
jgi:SAM-dependent methyltransferase